VGRRAMNARPRGVDQSKDVPTQDVPGVLHNTERSLCGETARFHLHPEAVPIDGSTRAMSAAVSGRFAAMPSRRHERAFTSNLRGPTAVTVQRLPGMPPALVDALVGAA
jgi:hypothetical protein